MSTRTTAYWLDEWNFEWIRSISDVVRRKQRERKGEIWNGQAAMHDLSHINVSSCPSFHYQPSSAPSCACAGTCSGYAHQLVMDCSSRDEFFIMIPKFIPADASVLASDWGGWKFKKEDREKGWNFHSRLAFPWHSRLLNTKRANGKHLKKKYFCVVCKEMKVGEVFGAKVALKNE
jgi:hypothetical protein